MKDRKEELLEQIKEKKRKLDILKNKMNKITTKEKKIEKNQDRRKRAHNLIKLGVLFELLDLENEEKDILTGFLMDYRNLTMNQKQVLKNRGKIFLENRKIAAEITKEQIMELLKIYNENGTDLMVKIKKEFKKISLEHLSYDDYIILKNIN